MLLNTFAALPNGELLTITHRDEKIAEYKGNVLSNAQAMVAKANGLNDFDGSKL